VDSFQAMWVALARPGEVALMTRVWWVVGTVVGLGCVLYLVLSVAGWGGEARTAAYYPSERAVLKLLLAFLAAGAVVGVLPALGRLMGAQASLYDLSVHLVAVLAIGVAVWLLRPRPSRRSRS
jgi:hypothetical protein